MNISDLEISSEVFFQEEGFYGLSLWSFPEMDAVEVAEEVGRVADEIGERLLPNSQMRHSTAGDLRMLGYVVYPDGDPRGHVTLVLDAAPTDTDWESLVGVFEAPQPNPIALRKKT